MVDENRTGKQIAKTLALPALLVISLLAARLAMQTKIGIKMSAPIKLNRSGLSVSMPSGNGWKCTEKWSFEDNSFNVSSIFAVSGLNERSYAQCRYLLAAKEDTPKERIGQEYSETKLVVTGQITTENLAVNWASIFIDSGVEIILGVCNLADGRQLEIEVLQSTDERGLAKEIFEKIVKSIKFRDNGLLQAGVRLISDIRTEGLNIVPADGMGKRPSSPFTISDSHNNIIGFTIDAMATAGTGAEANLNAADYYYLRGTVAEEQVGYFRGSGDLRQFTWRVETTSRTGRKGLEMSADAGTLTVRKFGTNSPFNRRTGKETGEYELGETAVPDIVLEPILTKVLDGNSQALIIDVIRSDGTVMPVHIEKMPPAREQTDSNYIRLDWLDGRGYWQETYYDASKKPVKIVLGQETTYTLNRSDANEIAQLFPERVNLVRDKKQLLDRENP
jgi:hypothetical protein